MFNFPTVMRETIWHDPTTGEPLYVEERIYPRWYIRLRRTHLFCLIVWREWEPGYRLSVRTAWDVSKVVWE